MYIKSGKYLRNLKYSLKSSLTILIYFYKFILNTLRLITIIRHYDKGLPFKGAISTNHGYCKLLINDNYISEINNLYEHYKMQGELDLVSLNTNDLIEEIFQKIHDPVFDYLGENCYLDGMYFSIINKEELAKSISGNWHTDNVGARLKVFICFEGDGNLPTYIIPNIKRIPTFRDYFKIFKYEFGRYIHRGSKRKFDNELALKHTSGSIYIFDTQLLHRGAYEKLVNRSILLLEFSPIDKHKFLPNSLGTKSYNSFKFNKNLLDIYNFSKLLDKKRIYKNKDRYIYKDINI